MPIRLSRKLLLAAIGALALAGTTAELVLRALGYADLPLYRADPVLGYVPLEGAAGTFAGGRRWAFNAQGMRMDAPCQPGPEAVLLLGDSIVHGGTTFGQEQTLGARLTALSRRQVCPLGAGSWALENELQALHARPEFRRFGTVVLVVNSDDFVAPSYWQSEFHHPTTTPRSVLLTAVVKKVTALWTAIWSPPTPALDDRWIVSLERFQAGYRGHLVVVVYPRRSEIGVRAPSFAPLVARLGSRAVVVEPGPETGWNEDSYLDEVHPSPAGQVRLAELIGRELR